MDTKESVQKLIDAIARYSTDGVFVSGKTATGAVPSLSTPQSISPTDSAGDVGSDCDRDEAVGSGEPASVRGMVSPGQVSTESGGGRSTPSLEGKKAMLESFRGKIIALGGPICAGKTTLGKALRDHFIENGVDAVFHEERVHRRHLDLFYKGLGQLPRNPHAFSFQLDMLMQCAYVYTESAYQTGKKGDTARPKVVIIDRAAWDNYVFALLHYISGNINESEMEIYVEKLRELGAFHLDYVVYLHVSAEKAHKRIHEVRKSKEESGVPLAYCESLERAYFLHLRTRLEQERKSGETSTLVVSNEIWCNPKQVISKLVSNVPPPSLESLDLLDVVPDPKKLSGVFDELCRHYGC